MSHQSLTLFERVLIAIGIVAAYILGSLVAWNIKTHAADLHSQLVTVRRDTSARGVAVYELRGIDGSAVTVMTDADLPIAKWLAEHRDTRVTITLEAK